MVDSYDRYIGDNIGYLGALQAAPALVQGVLPALAARGRLRTLIKCILLFKHFSENNMLEYRSWNFYVLKLFFRINIFQKYLVSECLKLSGCKMWYGGDSFIAFGIRNSTPNDIIVTVWAISVRAQFNSAVYYAWIYYIYWPQKPQTRENRFTTDFFSSSRCVEQKPSCEEEEGEEKESPINVTDTSPISSSEKHFPDALNTTTAERLAKWGFVALFDSLFFANTPHPSFFLISFYWMPHNLWKVVWVVVRSWSTMLTLATWGHLCSLRSLQALLPVARID